MGHRSGLLLGLGVLGLLVLIGLAGFGFDLLHRRGRSRSVSDEAAHRRAVQTLRYYRDVGDSTNCSGG